MGETPPFMWQEGKEEEVGVYSLDVKKGVILLLAYCKEIIV